MTQASTMTRQRSAPHAIRRAVPFAVSVPAPAVDLDLELIDALNRLIDTCADSAYGFASCADYSNISRHRAVFRKRAQECDTAREQLHELVQQLGGMPMRGGVASDSLHRGWVAVHGTLCGLCDASIVAECERGESETRERYRQVLDQELPTRVRTVVERQLRQIESSLQQIRSLRDALPPPARFRA
ncbi:MAG: PA2169 family four-helix-bundle protein [Rhodoferax sp.]|nr:PA2169 family four-helix-bundle protein [Rhodoferax sp.]